MPRRALTLLVAGIAVVAAALAAALLPVPYVVLSPGPTLNTLGTAGGGQQLIQISGHPVSHTSGHLNMVTVDYSGGPGDEINIFTALRAWLSPHNAVVPQQEIFGTGQSAQQVQQQDVVQMTGSQQTAAAAALTVLHIPFHTFVEVAATELGMPAAQVLKAGDIITAVDGVPVNVNTVGTQIRSHPVGTVLHLTVRRNGKTKQLSVKSVKAAGAGGTAEPQIGVEITPRYTFPFQIKFSVGDIGGPSAGMMFALGIIDKLGHIDLTGGRFIAGTGELASPDPAAAVQPIGGIQQKMAGARAQGATVFLSPAANCSDALGALPAGMKLIKVSTLAGAVRALEALKAGRSVPSC
jgi:PDZ domain-containing protein